MNIRKTLIATLIIALSTFVLMSCDSPSSRQYELVSKDDRRSTTIEVTWIPKDRISAKCISLGAQDGRVYRGCARSHPKDVTICEIYAVQPRDFDDRDALYHFGHEAWHCFGAKHD